MVAGNHDLFQDHASLIPFPFPKFCIHSWLGPEDNCIALIGLGLIVGSRQGIGTQNPVLAQHGFIILAGPVDVFVADGVEEVVDLIVAIQVLDILIRDAKIVATAAFDQFGVDDRRFGLVELLVGDRGIAVQHSQEGDLFAAWAPTVVPFPAP